MDMKVSSPRAAPDPQEAVNYLQGIAAAWQDLALSPKQEAPIKYLRLVSRLMTSQHNHCVAYLMRGHQVIAAELTVNHEWIVDTKKLEDGDTIELEGLGAVTVSHLEVGQRCRLTLLTTLKPKAKARHELMNYYHAIFGDKDVTTGRRRGVIMGLLFLILVSMFIPLREKTDSSAVAVGDHETVISAEIEGVIIERYALTGDLVRAGDVIGQISEDHVRHRLNTAELELEKLYEKWRVQGRRDSVSKRALAAEIEAAKVTVQYHQGMVNKTAIIAIEDGILQWSKNRQAGSYIRPGEVLATTQKAHIHRLKSEIYQADWINSQVGDAARFYDSVNKKVINGTIYAIEPRLTEKAGQPAYVVRIDIDDAIANGQKGDLRIIGKETRVWNWLLKKPLDYIRRRLPELSDLSG